jgi:hypothetical protein
MSCEFKYNTAYFAGGAIYSALQNDMSVTFSTFTKNYATYGGGIYIGSTHTDIYFSNSIFISNIAVNGAGMYFNRFNKYIIINQCNYYDNIAGESGAAITYISEELTLRYCNFASNIADMAAGIFVTAGSGIDITYCHFEDNYASAVGSSIAVVYSKYIHISNCTLDKGLTPYGAGGAITMLSSSYITIKYCNITNNYAEMLGGGIYCSSLKHTELDHIVISNCSSGTRGAAMYIEKCENFNILNSDFTYNTAFSSGGGIFFDTANQLIISNCVFKYNIATYGDGGGLWLSESTLSFNNSNIFSRNYAGFGGGCVYWLPTDMTEPVGLHSSNLTCDNSNIAAFGSKFATEATYLLFQQSSPVLVSNYEDYYIPVISVVIEDYYNQLVVSGTQADIDISISSSCTYINTSGYVAGVINEAVEYGIATFDQLQAYCAPGYQMDIKAFTLIYTFTNYISLQDTLTLSFQSCTKGQYYDNNICINCPIGSYSLSDNSDLRISQCQSCPSNSETCYGSYINVKSGYWRISNISTTILPCVYGDIACQGGWNSGDASCNIGYEGPLCAVCSDGYYYSSMYQKCIECSGSNSINIFTVLIATIIVLIVIILCILKLYLIYSKSDKTMYNIIYTLILQYTGDNVTNDNVQSTTTSNILTNKVSKWSKLKNFAIRIKIYTTLIQVFTINKYSILCYIMGCYSYYILLY